MDTDSDVGTRSRDTREGHGTGRRSGTRRMDPGHGHRQKNLGDIDIKYKRKYIRKITTWILSNTVFLAAWQRKMMTFNEFPRHI
jgi:hypothetical protein